MFLLLVAVFLPPAALDILGPVVEERTVQTPFGMAGPLARRVGATGTSVWVLPYTGSPTRTDPRATIYAAYTLGVKRLLVWDSAIALNEALGRGQTAVVVDTIDWTRHLPTTLRSAADIELSEQVTESPRCCPLMTAALRATITPAEVVYLGTEEARRETPAEARMFRHWGADVIGHNLIPEIFLAHELAIDCACLVTVSETSADRPPAPHLGELRYSLNDTLTRLPALVAAIANLEN
jgi:purine nucleoside phosphorylase